MIAQFVKRTAVLGLMILPALAAADQTHNYLALGDSIAFGYDPTLVKDGTPLPTPDKFSGYPDVVANLENLPLKNEINAACPGQTSLSFLFPAVVDYGCQGFKAAIGLHTTYDGSQEAFAIARLTADRTIKLVTLSIGGNDLVLLQLSCSTAPASEFAACIQSGLPGVLASYGQNLAIILSSIRGQAKYTGKLVLVNNYVPNADPLFAQAVGALNQVMAGVGSQFKAKMADSFTAFQIISAPFGHDPCKAGLLVRLSATTCDVHPSKFGRDVLGVTVELALH